MTPAPAPRVAARCVAACARVQCQSGVASLASTGFRPTKDQMPQHTCVASESQDTNRPGLGHEQHTAGRYCTVYSTVSPKNGPPGAGAWEYFSGIPSRGGGAPLTKLPSAGRAPRGPGHSNGWGAAGWGWGGSRAGAVEIPPPDSGSRRGCQPIGHPPRSGAPVPRQTGTAPARDAQGRG